MFKQNQTGRSMIEMLGVLAIVGILSIGGIAGFSKAMSKYKLNQALEQYNFVFNLIVYDMDKWRRLAVVGSYELAPILKNMGILPQNMIRHPTDSKLYDVFGNSFYVRKKTSQIQLGVSMNIARDDMFISFGGAKELCQALYVNEISQRHTELMSSYLYFGSGSGNGQAVYIFYGDAYCGAAKKCIRNMTIEDIVKICSECEQDKLCRFILEWPL